MSAFAHSLGLEVHAGHGLTYDCVGPVAALPQVRELNIGHFLIGEAIFRGLPDAIAEMRRIMDAARAANAHAFIMAKGDGYDTHVGERGSGLSGGERQRIAIARAILHDPKILILDEATSSVDTETEQQIQKGMDQLLSGRIALVIAHRLSTIRNADRILVIEHGEITEAGSHDELMATQGRYSQLYTQQSLAEFANEENLWQD